MLCAFGYQLCFHLRFVKVDDANIFQKIVAKKIAQLKINHILKLRLKMLMKGLLLCFLFFNTAFCQTEYEYLDAIAVNAGADKGSFYHNYTQIYAKYFSELKNKPIKFLEIGIYKGSSVKMWEEYFTHADLHFIDINFDAIEYFSKRAHYHLCNQENREELTQLMQKTGGEFDVIIDDGGHTMSQQITSFTVLFPHIKRGGMYIIEDLHTSYWPHWGALGSNSTITFLKHLIDDVNFIGAHTAKASHLNIPASVSQSLNIYQEMIESIHFYDSVAIIIKR